MNATALHEDLVGRVVSGRYTLLRWLGSARGVDTFLTEIGDPSQKAAIKLVPADSGDAESRMASWIAAANLSHPNLIKVFASGRCELDSSPKLYVVTEYGDEVLAEVIPERSLTPGEAREMLSPAVDALAYLHAKGFVHAHLKPSNIMAVGDRLKLSTDGLQLAGAIRKLSIQRTIYDAPETVQRRIGPATDVWALGVTLVEVLIQRPPAWYGAAAAEPVVPENVPEPFATIAKECLRNDPARRSTLDQILARLDPGRPQPSTGKKSAAAKPSELKPAAAKPAKTASSINAANPRRRVLISLGAAAVLLAVFAIWQVRSHQKQAPSSAPEAQSAPAATPSESPFPAPATDQTASAAPAAPGRILEAGASPAPAAGSAPRQTTPKAPSQTPPAPTRLTGGTITKGSVASQVQPDVLASALRTISGTVKTAVRLTVNEKGVVTAADFESAGPSKYFANKALEAARLWTFMPAQLNGQAIVSSWILHFQFRQSGVTVTQVEAAP